MKKEDITYVVVDLETSGFAGDNDKILRIDALRVNDGSIGERFSEYIKQERQIPENVSRLTGIDNSFTDVADTEEEVLSDFLDFAKDAFLVSIAPNFDVAFLKEACKRNNKKFENPCVDLRKKCRTLLPGLKSYRSETVAEKLGIGTKFADDVSLYAAIFIRVYELMKEGNCFTLNMVNPCRSPFYPVYSDAQDKLERICDARIRELYGKKIPNKAASRLNKEIEAIRENGFAGLYMIWHDLVKKSEEDGYPVGTRGCVAASFTAYLLGITMINPLDEDFDSCPETFMGINFDREPDIDLNFAPDEQPVIQECVAKIPGIGSICRAGTVTAVKGEVRRGVHPGGILAVPDGMEISSFIPVEYRDSEDKIPVTGIDYHELDGMFLKLDILGHDDPLILKKMYELTGVDYAKITPDDDKVMSLFSDTAALGISPEDIGGVSVGTLGVSEFGNSCAVKMLEMLRPSAFSQLVKIDGLLHGTNVWEGNAKELIKSGMAGLDECIGTRDDVMQYLMDHDFDRVNAFRIMEAVRKGHGLSMVWTSAMEERNVPDWYIKSCNKIGYLFPRAHAASYTYMAWLTAWYKLYYPEEFYKVYFEVKGKACGEKNALEVLYVDREMHARRRCL